MLAEISQVLITAYRHADVDQSIGPYKALTDVRIYIAITNVANQSVDQERLCESKAGDEKSWYDTSYERPRECVETSSQQAVFLPLVIYTTSAYTQKLVLDIVHLAHVFSSFSERTSLASAGSRVGRSGTERTLE